MNHIEKGRQNPAGYFRSKAQWRHDVAEEKCRDGTCGKLKNELYTDRLDQIASLIESLASDDPIIQKAAGLDVSLLDELHTRTIHCEFRDIGARRWLELWIGDAIATAKDAAERLKEFDSAD